MCSCSGRTVFLPTNRQFLLEALRPVRALLEANLNGVNERPAVAVEPWDDMDVEVREILAGRMVVLEQGGAVGTRHVANGQGDPLHPFEERADEILGQVLESGVVDLRDDPYRARVCTGRKRAGNAAAASSLNASGVSSPPASSQITQVPMSASSIS